MRDLPEISQNFDFFPGFDTGGALNTPISFNFYVLLQVFKIFSFFNILRSICQFFSFFPRKKLSPTPLSFNSLISHHSAADVLTPCPSALPNCASNWCAAEADSGQGTRPPAAEFPYAREAAAQHQWSAIRLAPLGGGRTRQNSENP